MLQKINQAFPAPRPRPAADPTKEPDCLKKARRGETLSGAEKHAALLYLGRNLREIISPVFQSESLKDFLFFFQETAGLPPVQLGRIGPRTVAAFDRFLEEAQRPSSDNQPRLRAFRSLKKIAGMYDNQSPMTRELAAKIHLELINSSIWKKYVLGSWPGKTNGFLKSNSPSQDTSELAEFLVALGLLEPKGVNPLKSRPEYSYDELKTAVRKFNLITRSVSELDGMASLSREVGRKTLIYLKRAWELAALGADWWATHHWELFDFESYYPAIRQAKPKSGPGRFRR